MISFTNTLTIQKPIEEVFNFISNLENLPMWNYYILQVSAEGNTYRVERKNDVFRVEMVDLTSPHLLIYQTVEESKLFVRRTLRLSGEKQQVVITDTIDLNSRFPGFLEKLGKKRIKNAVAENLDKLRELLETGQCTLQDGRVSQIRF